jgi:YVTN family beta-propeller protein
MSELRVVASLTVSRAPEAAILRPRSQEIFVTGAGGIDRIHIPDLKLRLSSRPDEHPRSLVFSPDGRLAYYLLEPESPPAGPAEATAEPPHAGFSNIGILDCESGREVGQISVRAHLSHLAITSDGKTLLASDPAAGVVHLFDAAARKPLGTLPAGKGAGPLAIQVSGSKAFVSNTEEDKITILDTTTRQVLSHIELGMRPGLLLLKPDGGELFVLCPQASTLAIVDAFHDNVSQTLPSGRNPHAGVFRRDSSLLYIANSGDGSVTILDVQNRVVLASTPMGSAPAALALTPDERFLAVADEGTATLAVLIADPVRLANVRSALVTTIPVGAGPVNVVIPDWLGE